MDEWIDGLVDWYVECGAQATEPDQFVSPD